MAPFNTFYAESRKVTIDRVDMGVSDIETRRFCNKCVYKEMLGTADEKETCPNCGSPMWAEAGEKRNILPYRSVVVDEAQDMGVQAFKLI